MKRQSTRLLLLLGMSLMMMGCQKEEAPATETVKTPLHIGVTSVTSGIDPTNADTPWSLVSHGIGEKLYMLDAEGNLVSRMVEEMTQVGEFSWKMKLRPGVYFSDGSEVTAEAVAACMNEIMEKNEIARASAGIIDFTVDGDYELTLVSEKECKIMPSVLCEWTNIVYKELEDHTYAFTGPYQVKEFDPGVRIDMIPNPHYDERAGEREDVTLMVFKDGTAMKQAFESGELDLAFTVTPEAASLLEAEGHIVKNMDAAYQYFAIVNQRHEILQDAGVREALNLAINREDMAKALNGGSVAQGIFAGYYDFAGDSEVVFDIEKAKTLLDQSGWIANAEGKREKDGKPLELSLKTYATRPDLTVLMQLAASNLNELGITVSTEIVENIDTTGRSGEFDLIFYAQNTAPTGEPGYFLNQFFRLGQGKNFAGYESTKLDAILDQLSATGLGEERNTLAKEAQRVVFQDLPILYLLDPEWHIAVSERLENYQPYGGDYYIVNADLGLN